MLLILFILKEFLRFNKRGHSYYSIMEDLDLKSILDYAGNSESKGKLLENNPRKKIKTIQINDEVKFINNEVKNVRLNYEVSMAANIEGSSIFDLPNEKAWGRRKKKYYSTDYVDADYTFVSEKEIINAKLEEEEAKTLHIGLVGELDRLDFGNDLIVAGEYDNAMTKNTEHVQSDLIKLCKKQQQQFLEKESPEFILLAMDLQAQLYEMKEELERLISLVNKYNSYDLAAVYFIKAKYDILLHYCINTCFYLALKAKKVCTMSHPVIQKLSSYRQFLFRFEEHQGHLLDDITRICQTNTKFHKYPIEEKGKKKNIIQETFQSKSEQYLHNSCFNNRIIKHRVDKRAITHKIAKNKGLTPYRKKEQRNPRVKHRNKYHKAKISRKGAIREIITQVNRYRGEISGIKSTLKKSIKLK